jgi:type II secretory pathway component GspD/PulD (secretin)
VPGALAVAAGLTGPVDLALAQPATMPDPKMPAPGMPGAVVPIAPVAPVAPPATGDRTISFNFEKMGWDDVLDWYSKESGLTLITTVKPTGSLAFKPSKDKKFTMGEVTDLLNEALTQQKFILIRRNMTFFIQPADEKIDPTMVPRITLEELAKRGKTEIVEVILPIKGMVVADAQEELKRLLTPFGSMVPLEKSNSLLLRDTVGNIVRIQKTLDEVEGKNDSDSLNHVCKWRRAQEIAETLKTLLTDKDTQANVTGTQQMQMFVDPRYGGYSGGGWGGQPGGGWGDRGSSGWGDRGRGPGGAPTTSARVKTVQIAVDARRNAILVTAPQDKIGLAKQIIRDNDKQINPTDQEVVPQEPVVQTYGVPVGAAVELAKAIQAKHPWINIVALPAQNQLLVVAGKDDQKLVDAIVNGGGGTASVVAETTFIPLYVLDPGETAATITKLMPTTLAGGPSVEPQKTTATPGLLVKGTAAHIREIREIIEKLGEPKANGAGGTGASGPNTRTLNLGANTNATLVAEVLGKAMEGMGKKVIINDPLNPAKPREIPKLPSVPTPPTPKFEPPPAPMVPPGRGPTSDLRQPLPGRDYLVPVAAQIVDPDKKDDKPITIVVSGGKLIISSKDTEALDVLQQLYRVLMTDGNTPLDSVMKVIPLKFVAAEDAAREITEIFNGPQQQQGGGRQQGGLGGLNPLALLGLGGGGGGQAAPTPGRVRVVAEKSSNSLIVVRASPLDVMMIEKLLGSVIDGGQNDSAALLKTFVIPVKNAEASDIASAIKGLYKNAMGTTGGNPQMGAFPFLAMGGGQPQQGAQRPPALTVEVDDRSNSLLLLCAETMYQDIKVLVAQLDNATVSTTEVVKLVQLKGVDPNVIQQAINALQGRDTRNQGMGGFGGRGQGGFGQGGGGFGQGGGGIPGLGGGGFGGLGGGGGFPGIGGGGFGGGGNRGGGGGGMRGGGGGGRGGRVSYGPTTEGYRNFDYRGMDAPSARAAFKLYDPQTDAPDLGYNRPAPKRPLSDIVQIGAWQPGAPGIDIPGGPVVPPMDPPRPPYSGGTGTAGTPAFSGTAPRGTITAIPVQGLDTVVVRATDSADMQIVLQLIEMLTEASKGTAPKVEVVYLSHGDCNYVATTLNSIFARVTIGQNGNYVPASARTAQQGALTALAGASPTQNVYCLALPRVNGILIAAPEGRFDDVVREMRKLLDAPNERPFKAFYLKKASAQLVASQLQNFWNTRYPGETLVQNQFRVTFDVANNIVFVQGSNSDLADVEEFLKYMDTPGNQAINDMRVFYLRNALADELGQILSNALSSNVVSPIAQSQQTGPVAQQAGGAALFNQGQQGQGLQGLQQGGLQQLQQLQQPGGQFQQPNQQGPGGLNQLQVRTINAIIPTIGSGASGGLVTKTTAIRFFSAKDGKTYETGYLEDVHIVPSARVNALIVSAPEKTMKLIEKLIDNLDTVAAARSYVNVYQLKKGMDATLTANLIAQLFTGQGRQQQQGIAQPGQNQNQTVRPLITLSPNPSDGASLIDLRLSVDDRTNSLIVAGSRNDLDSIGAIIGRLEGVDVQNRYNEVYKLRNAAAADVANALQTYFNNVLNAYTAGGFNTPYTLLQRQVFVTAEPVSNTILISATPEHYGEIRKIIDRIDSQPPQVMIQVTIAEVQLNNAEELGMEVGLQSPVLFRRGNTTPGFNFNTPGPQATLPNSSILSAETVGFQGLGALNIGRTSATQGFGGFVFSASSNTFSLLVRALKAQGRVEVLSRPQVQVADNQTGFMNVGQRFPIPTTSTITNGLAQQGVQYENIGITLRVTPRVNPDGKVLMRVEPSVTSAQPGTVNIGNGLLATVFNEQTVNTTVLASDGETIILGGLITKQDAKQENGIPYMKDIPYVGALFRYRTHSVQRRELIFIMTPHIIRSEYDQARLLAEEIGPTKHCWPDIMAAHKHGNEVIGPALKGARPVPVNPAVVPAPQPYTGPAYFGGTYDASAPNFVPNVVQPGALVPPQPAYPPAQPAYQPQQVPPGAMLPMMPAQPVQPFVPNAPPTLPVGQPGAMAPQSPMWPGAPSGVMPIGATQPTFTAPPFATQPAAPIAPAVAPTYAQPRPAAPPYTMVAPGAPAPTYPMSVPQPLPGMPVVPGTANRGYYIAGGQPQQPQQPAQDAPATTKPKPAATEGKPWTFGR